MLDVERGAGLTVIRVDGPASLEEGGDSEIFCRRNARGGVVFDGTNDYLDGRMETFVESACGMRWCEPRVEPNCIALALALLSLLARLALRELVESHRGAAT